MIFLQKIKKYAKYINYLAISFALFFIIDSIIQLNPQAKQLFDNNFKFNKEEKQYKCTNNYKLVYFSDSELSKKVGENQNLVNYLFSYGENQCNLKNYCLTGIFVDKDGYIQFNCSFTKNGD